MMDEQNDEEYIRDLWRLGALAIAFILFCGVMSNFAEDVPPATPTSDEQQPTAAAIGD